MKNIFTRIAMLALPALLTVGCGGDDLFGLLDGGTGACPANTTLYRIQEGAYNTLNATITSDTCNVPPLMPSEVMSTRSVVNDTVTGTITVKGSAGGTIGSGPIRCNTGSITASEQIKQAPCQYQSTRTSQMTITGNSTFTLDFTDVQTDFTSSGGTCVPPSGGTCTTRFTVTMQHQ